MNKKIKMIELLNMIANGELKDKTRFKVYSSCKDDSDIPYICEYDKTEPGIIWCITSYDTKFNFKIDYMRILNYYVEIIEDTPKKIEKIKEIDKTGIRTSNEQVNMELKRIDNQRIEDLQELLEEIKLKE